MKKTVTPLVHSLGLYELDGTLGSAIKRLQELKAEYGEDAKFDHFEQQYKYETNSTTMYGIYVPRLETDEEEAARLAQEAKNLEYQKQQYEHLKKQFG